MGAYHVVEAEASDDVARDALHVAQHVRSLILVLNMASIKVPLKCDTKVSLAGIRAVHLKLKTALDIERKLGLTLDSESPGR